MLIKRHLLCQTCQRICSTSFEDLRNFLVCLQRKNASRSLARKVRVKRRTHIISNFPWRNLVSVRITSSYSIFHLGPFCLEPTEDLVGRRLDDQTNIGCWSYNLHFDPLAEKLWASWMSLITIDLGSSPIVWVARSRNIWHPWWEINFEQMFLTSTMRIRFTWLESTKVARSRAVQPDFALTEGIIEILT